MVFKNRMDAGRQLAVRLTQFAERSDLLVLGIPRGGVAVAFEVAKALHAPLDVFLSRKLGVPGNPELAFGAVASDGGRFLDESTIRATGVTTQQIATITSRTLELLRDRAEQYRGRRPRLPVAGRTVILVDDGIATGASIYAAIRALRQLKPAKLIVAVPVAPQSTCDFLEHQVDMLLVLETPDNFYAVGQFYEDFGQVTDDQVVDYLARASTSSWPLSIFKELSMPIDGQRLHGDLSVPFHPKGIVLFAHGSGSSRHSPRNRYIAEELQKLGFATLLFDLLTPEEERIDSRDASLRFDIQLLADRLVNITEWLVRSGEIGPLPIGYFGASTGAAAALEAAAQFPEAVHAVVSRGGRPDLASESLPDVQADTLLIVGEQDETVLRLNRHVLQHLGCKSKQLAVVPGATHLFEEPGALEQVAKLAGSWFLHHLASGSGAFAA